MHKLAIISTHPIQYNAPLFKMLRERNNVAIKVFYTWSQSESGKKFDPGFGRNIEWDIPLLEGYEYSFSANIAKIPGTHHFNGINNPNLISEIVDWKPDAILVYGWSFKSHFKLLRYFKGKIPVLFRGDSTLLDESNGIKKILRRLFLKYVFLHVDIALYVGEANRKYFKANGLKNEQLFFMPHAIDNARFNFNEENNAKAIDLRNSLSIKPSEIIFLFVGKLETKKQPNLLAKAFVECKSPNAQLVFVGNGILEEELIKEYKSNKNIHFLGFQNQSLMPAIYAMCNVFVLPSSGPGETWGLAINEAMAAGKAIITSDACGASYDLIKNNENGFIFPKNNFELLKSKIAYFIDNEIKIIKMGINSNKIIQDYSYLNDCIALETVVKKCCTIK